MNIATTAQVVPVTGLPSDGEHGTRGRVARAVGAQGPVTATQLAAGLGLTPAAVRRHLDAMLAEGLIAVRQPLATQRRRGRPAKAFVLTDAGHGSLATAYEDLASAAMAYLAEQLGPQAVQGFAARRVADLERRYAPFVAAAGAEVGQQVQALSDALARDGFAASTRPVGAPGAEVGIQLCQGHCPVQHVAELFPQLCEAEAEVFSRLLGVHVQRLATLAGGAHVCTTHIPTTVAPGTPVVPSRPPPAAPIDLAQPPVARPEGRNPS